MSSGSGGNKKRKVVKKLLKKRIINDRSRTQDLGSPTAVSTVSSYFTEQNAHQFIRQTATDPHYPVSMDRVNGSDRVYIDDVEHAMSIVSGTDSGPRGSSNT